MEVDKLELMKDCVDVFQIGARNSKIFHSLVKQQNILANYTQKTFWLFNKRFIGIIRVCIS